jgi:hypothetical protein
MTTLTISNGMIVLVESDKKGEWWPALPWQFESFASAMEFGTMKSMGGHYVDVYENTKPFVVDDMKYRYIIKNDWGPCWIENLTTKKKRKIKYFELGDSKDIFRDSRSLTGVIPSKFKF